MEKLIKNTILVAVTVFLGLFLIGCEKSNVEPVVVPPVEPETVENLTITSVSRSLEYFNEYAIVIVNEGTSDEVVIDSNTELREESSKLDIVCHCTFYVKKWSVQAKSIKTIRIYNRVNGDYDSKFNITVSGNFGSTTNIKWDTKETPDEGYVNAYYWSK